MHWLLIIAVILLPAGCAVYSIRPASIDQSSAKLEVIDTKHEDASQIVVRRDTNHFDRDWCSDPWGPGLTLFVIPIYCDALLQVTVEDQEHVSGDRAPRTYKRILVVGWVALLLAPWPQWEVGGYNSSERRLVEIAMQDTK